MTRIGRQITNEIEVAESDEKGGSRERAMRARRQSYQNEKAV